MQRENNKIFRSAVCKRMRRPTFEDAQVNHRVGASSLSQQHTCMTSVQSAISYRERKKQGEKERVEKRERLNLYLSASSGIKNL